MTITICPSYIELWTTVTSQYDEMYTLRPIMAVGLALTYNLKHFYIDFKVK